MLRMTMGSSSSNGTDYGSLTTPMGQDQIALQLGHADSNNGLPANEGSSILGAAFNLTNSTVGAGCIGLAGAIACSGGLVSLISILFFAVLSKYSIDLVIILAVQVQGGHPSSYENLGFVAYGSIGRLVVIISKGLYSFGCLVAYIVIVKDNFSFALVHLIYGDNDGDDVKTSLLKSALSDRNFVTIFLCSTVMLPLSLLREVKALERFSALKITVVLMIAAIVIYLFAVLENGQQALEGQFVDRWLMVYDGVFESLGTFLFTFVAQHTVNLVFESLSKEIRDVGNFKKVSTLSMMMTTAISLVLGFFVYMTFWEDTTSSMFQLYPSSAAVDTSRILLCMSMLLTYPFPFLTVRELIILAISLRTRDDGQLEQSGPLDPLIPRKESYEAGWLLPGHNGRQLVFKYHVALTVSLWSVTLYLALAASSLGDVLNLVGCTTGTVIAFILPALFSYKIQGHTILGSVLFVVGGAVGLLGTFYSLSSILR